MMSINAAVDRLRIAAGHVPGVRLVDVTFRNPDIGTGTVPETVSPAGGLIALRAAAAVVELVSSSTADDGSPAGTGAQTVRVSGLDADYNEVHEDFVMNGTTAVVGSVLFLRINHVDVLTAGSGGTNAGNITVRDSGAGTTRSYIDASRGMSEVGVYTVPAGHKMLATGWLVASRDATGISSADVEFFATKNGVRKISWMTIVSGTVPANLALPHVWEEKTDIEVVVSRVLNAATVVTFHGHGVLLGPNADI